METIIYYTGATVWAALLFGFGWALAYFASHAVEAAVMARRVQKALRVEPPPLHESTFKMWWHFFCDPCDVLYTNTQEVRWPAWRNPNGDRYGRTMYRITPKPDA